ncbi:MAG: DHH family phosphoesterase [Phycisphaeraceae bacterium]|nr:DHH family phosphoesterase [Phycisphaeraceae bacterium]
MSRGAGERAGPEGSAPGPYVGNIDAARAAARLRSAKRVVVTTHVKPDGDAIGSVLAILRMVRRLGGEAHAWLGGPVDLALGAFLRDEHIGDPRRALPTEEPDMVVVVDTGSWSQLDLMAPWVRSRAEKTLLIDHHRGGDPTVASERLIDPACASTTQLLLRVVDALEVPLRAPGEREQGSLAEALFIGLATDTGWFRFSNADAAVFDAVARLLRAGVSKDRLYRIIEETARPERMRILARALASLELHAAGKAAVMVLSREDFSSSGGGPEDLSGLINVPMAIGSVEVSVLLSQSEVGEVKLSFRSKPPIEAGGAIVDVNAFAARFGGGGHVHAAGARIKGTLDEVLQCVRAELDTLKV